MRPEPRRTAERLGLDQRTIRWLEAHGHLQRLALTETEVRARLFQAHLTHLRSANTGDRVAPGSTTSKAIRGREGDDHGEGNDTHSRAAPAGRVCHGTSTDGSGTCLARAEIGTGEGALTDANP